MMNEWIISSSLLIAAVLLGRWLLRGKISLRLQYALWAVVLIRLLLPFQIFTSSFGAGTMAQNVDISEPVRQVYVSAREDDYEREYDIAYSQVVAEYQASSRTYDPVVVEREAQTRAEHTMELDLHKLLWGIWFAGMVVMTSVIVSCNVHLGLHLKRRRRELPVPDCLLPVYITEAVPTPCIFGLFHPAIYLTRSAAGDESVRSHVLAHELTHYRHWDHIWSVLRSLCLILHWYNPLVWIAAKVSRADAELACDEGALAKLGEDQRGDYGRTLIGLTCPDHGGSMFVTATTMTGSAGSIRERIRLLMKRPRNTVLALTAVVLIGTIIVGCTFAGAPETTEPVESTEPTGHTPDNDMSYQGQELPIPEIPADIFNDEGVLVYPGVEWFMTEDEVMAALGITHNQILDSQKINENGNHVATYFTVNLSDAFGVSMVLDFMFRAYGADEEPVLTEVYGMFVHAEDFDAVRSMYAHALGETDAKMNPGVEERWDGDVTFRELLGKEGYEILDRCAEAGDDALNLPASYVQWVDSGSKEIVWFTELPVTGEPADPTEAARESLSETSNLSALTRLWCGWTGFSENEFVASFTPEILDVVQTAEDAIMVYYRRPGEQQLYVAEMMPHEDGWAVSANRLVLSRPDGARNLTDEEIDRVSAAFKPDIYDEERGEGIANPLACIVNDYYDDVTKLDRSELLAYFPGSTDGTEQEFELLKEKYPDFFGGWTWEEMPIPIHSYDPKELNNTLQRYADIRWEDLAWDEDLHYLEETGCFYNYTSDFGLMGFHCTGGWVYDGGAVLYSSNSALYLTERSGNYYIQAHLPAMVFQSGSQPMIPAEG